MENKKGIDRRSFIKNVTTAGIGLSVLPSYVLGGSKHIPPSEKINVGLIGFGAQSFKMLPGWLNTPELQFTAVCDPNEQSYDYPDWGSPDGEIKGLPGGRKVGQQLINKHYSENRNKENFSGCSAYADFREMFAKEKDLDAVFIMTPDHLHSYIAVAAMENGLKVSSHKPIGNFIYDARVACETARDTGIKTHLFAFRDKKENYLIQKWIDQGVIGKVKELHRWTNRPMWPQGSPTLPKKETIPEGFDWDLWLGPSPHRDYSSDYTHAVFRGWHEFGSGCLGDMGYYGFLVDWRVLNLGMPHKVNASASRVCDIIDYRSSWLTNKVSFPHASTVEWEVPFKDTNDTIDVFWSSGGIRPQTPDVLRAEGRRLPPEGVMFIGENGIILDQYWYGDPQIIGVENAEDIALSINDLDIEPIDYEKEMVKSFKEEKESRGSFLEAQTVAEAICLGNMAIRADQEFRSDKILEWDNQNLMFKNMDEANKFVKREVRQGWEI